MWLDGTPVDGTLERITVIIEKYCSLWSFFVQLFGILWQLYQYSLVFIKNNEITTPFESYSYSFEGPSSPKSPIFAPVLLGRIYKNSSANVIENHFNRTFLFLISCSPLVISDRGGGKRLDNNIIIITIYAHRVSFKVIWSSLTRTGSVLFTRTVRRRSRDFEKFKLNTIKQKYYNNENIRNYNHTNLMMFFNQVLIQRNTCLNVELRDS